MDLAILAQVAAITSSGLFAGLTPFWSRNIFCKNPRQVIYVFSSLVNDNVHALASDLVPQSRFHVVSLLRGNTDNHLRSRRPSCAPMA